MFDEPLVEVGDFHFLGDLVDSIRGIRYRSGYGPEPWAKMWADAILFSQSSDPVEPIAGSAYDLAASQLGAADDHVLALEAVLSYTETGVAPYVLGRAAIEAAGRAYQLLDPDISHRERAVLVLAESLSQLYAFRDLIRAHTPDDSRQEAKTDLAEVDADIDEIKRYLRQQGLPIPNRAGFSSILRNVLAMPGSFHFGVLTAVLHSAVAHSVPNILVTLTVGDREVKPHPMNVGLIGLDEGKVMDLVLAVCLAYSRGVSRQVEMYAWPPTAWKRATGRARRILRTRFKGRHLDVISQIR